MSLTRSASELHLQAPPPSPIPTGKGLRSAANATLCEYLAKSLNVPDLALPEPHVPIDGNNDQVLEEIGYRSLESGDSELVDRVLMSAREKGTFLISDHGILGEELRSLELESGTGLERYSGEIGRVRSRSEMEWAREFVEDERYRIFREKMENIASKLDAIAEKLCQVLIRNSIKEHPGKIIEGKESVLSLCKHNHTNEVELEISEKTRKLCDYTLCLLLPLRQSQFFVESAIGPLHFVAGSDSIVVTLGNRIQEWRHGDFKCISGEVICEPYLHRSQASFSIQLKCFTSDYSLTSKKSSHTISIRDQIVIGLVLGLLYKFFVSLFS